MFVTNWSSTTKIQKISEITNFFRHYFLSRTEVKIKQLTNIGYKDTYFLQIKQIFSKQFDIKYQLYGTLCIFFVYFITFRKRF